MTKKKERIAWFRNKDHFQTGSGGSSGRIVVYSNENELKDAMDDHFSERAGAQMRTTDLDGQQADYTNKGRGNKIQRGFDD